jgi:hypothetical protein
MQKNDTTKTKRLIPSYTQIDDLGLHVEHFFCCLFSPSFSGLTRQPPSLHSHPIHYSQQTQKKKER